MGLEVFSKNDFEQLITWISSDELNYLWGGPTYSYPLTYQQIVTHCRQPEVMPFIFKVAGQNAGFIELFHVSDEHYRICRVFIANEYHGQGLSKEMVESVIVKAQADFGCEIISLAVFDHNTVAKNCYKSLGFNIVATELGTRSYKGKVWNLVRMEKRLS
tara:strand:- start:3933 stop:4412 length:480 start_codon:yes stop_codon:yes gene_type:complete